MFLIKIKYQLWRVVLVLFLPGMLLLQTACTEGNLNNSTRSGTGKIDDRPNIVVILADDLGFSDLGCYGGEVETPHLNRLAADGLRLTSFYNTARCCPSRASLLTGLYSHQAGIGRMTMDAGLPGYQGTLDDQAVTIAELLKAAGYRTGMTGKWHVSITDRDRLSKEDQLKWLAHQGDYGPFSDTTTYPTARGFEKYFGNIWGVVDYFDPFSLVNGTEAVESVPPGYYYTDAIGDTAVAYVEEFAESDQPFFLYVAHCAPHWPLQAPKEEIEKYKDTYVEGWRSIRQKRYERMVEIGLIDPETAPLPEFMFPQQTWENNPDQVWDARAMAVHAAMVDRMDQSIGRLINKLDELGELDNTLIVFFSDNGASSERPSRYGPGFDRAGSTRSGEEVYFPVEKELEHLPGPQTVHSGIGPVWAHVANTPYRFWKARIYEGGIKTPMIMHWPAGFSQKGAFVDQPAHIVDLMPTFLELAKTEYPQNFNGKTLTPAVGKSMLPWLQKEEMAPQERTLFWEHFGSAALRQGDLKLVRLKKEDPWELYDLSVDATETKNLADQYPDKVKVMAEQWQTMADSLMVYPAPN